MVSIPNYVYIYRTSAGSVSVPAGSLEIEVVSSLDARRRRKRMSLKTFCGGNAVTKEIRSGSTQLLSLHSSAKRPPRREMLYGWGQAGTVIERAATDLLEAVSSLLQQMEEYGDDLAIEYGVFMNERDPVLHLVSPDRFETEPSPEQLRISLPCCWSSFYSGLRLPDDPHPYTIWASFGILDWIKHDPQTLLEIERSDIRSWERFKPANAGEIRIFRQTHDLTPLRTRLLKLRNLLQTTPDETVAMMAVFSGAMRERFERNFGMTVEERGMWPDPERQEIIEEQGNRGEGQES